MSDDNNHNSDAEIWTRSAYRAVSGDREGDVSFSGGHSSLTAGHDRLVKKNRKITARLPSPLPSEKLERQADLRGAADGAALYRRYHKDLMTSHINTAEAQAMFDMLEQVRCEAMGARHMKGVGDNLTAALESECIKKGYKDSQTVPMEDGLYALAFEALARHPLGPVSRRVANKWRLTIERQLGFGAFNKLFTLIENQTDFAAAADGFIRDLTGTDHLDRKIGQDGDDQDENDSLSEAEGDTASQLSDHGETAREDETHDNQTTQSSAQPLSFQDSDQDSDKQSEPVAGAQETSESNAEGSNGEQAANQLPDSKSWSQKPFESREKL